MQEAEQKRKWFDVVNEGGKDNPAEILIYGVIGSSFWSDGVEAKPFVDMLHKLEMHNQRINIRINSPGGSIWEGLPIFNAIKSSKAEIHTYVDGIAYSMGAIIALAGTKVHAAKNSLFLLHNALTSAYGNAAEMRKAADDLDKYDAVIMETVATKTGLPVDEVKATFFNYEDHLMTAQEAFDAKLIDIIEDADADNMPDNIRDMSPDEVIAYYAEKMEPMETKPAPKGFAQRAVSALLGILPAAAHREDVTEQVNAMQSENAELRRQLDALNAAANTQTQALEGFETVEALRAAYDEMAAKPGDDVTPDPAKPADNFDDKPAPTFEEIVSNMPHYKQVKKTLAQ